MLLSEMATGTYFHLVPWVVFFPVAGLLINILFGRILGERGVALVGVLAPALAFGVAVLQWVSLRAHPEGAVVVLADWMTSGPLQVRWAFRVDTLSTTMMLVVTGVGTLIHLYAVGYMHYDVRYKGDPGRYRRFFVFFNLFIAAMMILVSGDSLLTLFVGWEGVGLCSYLLIGFWFEYDTLGRPSDANAQAAKKAFITNRIGDAGMLLAMFLAFWTFKTLDFGPMFAQAQSVAAQHPGVILAITLFMLLAVTGKSAQLPLYVWLPDAMAGPTPVSALIHAATMVTAGVYLVARTQPFYALVPQAQHTVALVGALTALFAGTIAVGQYDIKKVLAYSTISQLGFMVAAVGMGAVVAGMFHLVTHAFFKALLFLSAGSVIIALERAHHPLPEEAGEIPHHEHGDEEAHGAVFDPQDMRNMGGLRKVIPLTFWVYLIGAVALAGIPPLAGFFSKDEIVAAAKAHDPVVYGLLVVAAFFTAFSMGRQIFLVFFGAPRSEAAAHAKESPAVMTGPLVALAFLSVVGGALNWPGVGTLAHWLEHALGEVHELPFNPVVAGSSTLIALVAVGLAWALYGRQPLTRADQPDPLKRLLGPIFIGMEHKWWVDELYWAIILQPYVRLSQALGRFDLGVIDAVGNGLAAVAQTTAQGLRRIQTGFVRNYALAITLGVVLMLGYLLWP